MSDEAIVIDSKSGKKLGRSGILDPKILIELKYRRGWRNHRIAEHFGVSPAAVGQALKRIKLEGMGEIYSRGRELAAEAITVQSLIAGLMADAADILKQVKYSIEEDDNIEGRPWDKMDIEKRKLQLSTMSEIRSQIAMYQQVAKDLFSFEANEEFQKIVVDTIREESPEVAEKIKAKLSRQQPLREFIGAAGRRRTTSPAS